MPVTTDTVATDNTASNSVATDTSLEQLAAKASKPPKPLKAGELSTTTSEDADNADTVENAENADKIVTLREPIMLAPVSQPPVPPSSRSSSSSSSDSASSLSVPSIASSAPSADKSADQSAKHSAEAVPTDGFLYPDPFAFHPQERATPPDNQNKTLADMPAQNGGSDDAAVRELVAALTAVTVARDGTTIASLIEGAAASLRGIEAALSTLALAHGATHGPLARDAVHGGGGGDLLRSRSRSPSPNPCPLVRR